MSSTPICFGNRLYERNLQQLLRQYHGVFVGRSGAAWFTVVGATRNSLTELVLSSSACLSVCLNFCLLVTT